MVVCKDNNDDDVMVTIHKYNIERLGKTTSIPALTFVNRINNVIFEHA